MKMPKTRYFMGAGTVVRKRDEGYGFIKYSESERDIFFSKIEVIGTEFRDLDEGEIVQFDMVMGQKGRVAANVSKEIFAIEEEDHSNQETDSEKKISLVIEVASQKLAELIACNPDVLKSVEWRDLERVLAVVFAGLGFTVDLTPMSKDGGKDIEIHFVATTGKSSFLIEVKHWQSRVGSTEVSKFLHVIAKSKSHVGLMIATNGFSRKAVETLTEYERRSLRFGSKEKIVTLCKHYVRSAAGVWFPPRNIEDLVFENTL